MKLIEIRKAYEFASGKLSDSCKQLCFAGIGIIWIFAITGDGRISISDLGIIVLMAFVLCLIFDILQYATSTYKWNIFYQKKRKDGLSEEDEVNESENKELLNFPWWFFVLKLIVLGIGYILLLLFLCLKINIQ